MKIRSCLLFLCIACLGRAADVALSLRAIDQSLARVAAHARNYPPQFTSDQERRSIERELKATLALLDAAVAQYPNAAELLLRDGFANALGHNLDFAGCDERADQTYRHLLELAPDNAKANFYFGSFLAGTTAHRDQCVKYLLRAVELGLPGANYTLAFYYLGNADRVKALHHLRAYVKAFPNDSAAKNLVGQIERGDYRTELKRDSPPDDAPKITFP